MGGGAVGNQGTGYYIGSNVIPPMQFGGLLNTLSDATIANGLTGAALGSPNHMTSTLGNLLNYLGLQYAICGYQSDSLNNNLYGGFTFQAIGGNYIAVSSTSVTPSAGTTVLQSTNNSSLFRFIRNVVIQSNEPDYNFPIFAFATITTSYNTTLVNTKISLSNLDNTIIQEGTIPINGGPGSTLKTVLLTGFANMTSFSNVGLYFVTSLNALMTCSNFCLGVIQIGTPF
jgi:hypothetical protein